MVPCCRKNTLLTFRTTLTETITEIIVIATFVIDKNSTGKLRNSQKNRQVIANLLPLVLELHFSRNSLGFENNLRFKDKKMTTLELKPKKRYSN